VSIFKKKIGRQGTWLNAIRLLLSPLIIIFSVRWILLEPFVIPSSSMEPTLVVHDHIVVQKFIYGIRSPFGEGWLYNFKKPKHGDVIVFRYPENEKVYFIKRLIGIPGDKVIIENGQITVNGLPWTLIPTEDAGIVENADFNYFIETVPDYDKIKQFKEKSLLGDGKKDLSKLTPEEIELRFEKKLQADPNQELREIETTDHFVRFRADLRHVDPVAKEFVVPDNSYFVMGDNRDESHDSRFWGVVPHNLLVGKAVRIWLSCHSTLENAPTICDPTKMRMDRIYKEVK
jgi:signal peptidase I